nr:pregnancy-specific beta-1-glycoprotein 7-like [Anolis sagrei ordinatus]
MGVLLGAESGSPSKLLAVFVVLSICFLSTEAYLKLTNIEMKPPKPKEGGSVLLTPVTRPSFPVSCRWYRREMSENDTILTYFFYPNHVIQKDPRFSGHEIMKPDCSLEIRNVQVSHSDEYMILIHGRGEIRTGSVKLVIPGRGFSKAAIAGAVLGSLGAIVILSVLLFTIYRE